jgi:HSP20 family protein
MERQIAERKRYRVPVVEIRETPTEVIVQAEMPGVEKNDFDIKVDSGELTLRGKKKPLANGLRVIHQESDSSDYLRTFILGEELDTANIEAKAEHGVLTLTLRKKKEAAPQKIAVQGA